MYDQPDARSYAGDVQRPTIAIVVVPDVEAGRQRSHDK